MKTILIIDDEEAALSVYSAALEGKGYRVITASSGDAGLALAHRHLPDLILSDIQMPGTDGRSVLQTLRADPELCGRQIVLMTGNPNKVTPRAGMELGADDFLIKPFALEELRACVEARLRRANVHWRVEDRVLSDLRSTLGAEVPNAFLAPLAGILGLVEVLRDEITVLSPGDIDDLLGDISRSGLRLHRTLRNYLRILELQTGKEGKPSDAKRFLNVDDCKSAVLSAVGAVLKRHDRKPDFSLALGDCRIAGKIDEVASIAEELLENACSFSRQGTPIQVRLGADGVLSVSDQGRGMEPQQLEKIGTFPPFDRNKLEHPGLGLGLVLVQKLMARCGGSFSIESQVGQGTTARAAFQTPPPGG